MLDSGTPSLPQFDRHRTGDGHFGAHWLPPVVALKGHHCSSLSIYANNLFFYTFIVRYLRSAISSNRKKKALCFFSFIVFRHESSSVESEEVPSYFAIFHPSPLRLGFEPGHFGNSLNFERLIPLRYVYLLF